MSIKDILRFDTIFGNLEPFKNGEECFFISPQELFLFSRYLNFCLEFLVMQKNDLIRRIRLISKFMMPQPGKQTIAIHILLNNSISKGNQAMKISLLKECNRSIVFLEKSYAKYNGESIPRLYLV